MVGGVNPLGRLSPVSANKEIRALVDAYLASPPCAALRLPAREAKQRLIELFVRLCYEMKARAPQYLTGAELEDLLKEVMPRYVDAKDAAAPHLPALVGSLFDFIESDRKLNHSSEVRATLKQAAEHFKGWLDAVPADKRLAFAKQETIVNAGSKAGRNDPCPCGSGKKFKKCCGSTSP